MIALGAIHRPLGEVGAGAVEWTAEQLQALIQDYNVMGLRLLQKSRVLHELYTFAAMSNDVARAGVWYQYLQQANALWDGCRRRKDWIYELAYYTGTDRWEPLGPTTIQVRRTVEQALQEAHRQGFVQAPLGAVAVIAAGSGVAIALMALVAYLAHLDTKDREIASTLELAKSNHNERRYMTDKALDPKTSPETADALLAIVGDSAHVAARKSPTVGGRETGASGLLVPVVLLAGALYFGPKFMGGRGRA